MNFNYTSFLNEIYSRPGDRFTMLLLGTAVVICTVPFWFIGVAMLWGAEVNREARNAAREQEQAPYPGPDCGPPG